MSRGDAENKEDTLNLLSPWSVVFFIPNILSLDFSFLSYRGTTCPCTPHLTHSSLCSVPTSSSELSSFCTLASFSRMMIRFLSSFEGKSELYLIM
jgi:hypothetical protein